MNVKNINLSADLIKYLILLTVIAISVMSIVIVAINVGKYKVYFNGNKEIKSSYETAIGDILLEQSKVEYVAGMYVLTLKITNNGVTKNNLRFKVKLIAYDGSTITEITAYVGNIQTNEIKYIDSYISKNVLSSENIKYEIVE
ncbi:MAG: hypothetical protein PHD15_06140 [Clostridia bacterium]|nr:hypothetical protein [Clostridia bacterium]MDD4387310.1 hypothetical protein [Clostridia bacterium]